MDRVGPYELRRTLGRGGMGSVHEAVHAQSGQEVAVKLSAAMDGQAARRLVVEARALARLRHPNVVAVHDAGEDRGRAWMSLELVRGRSLQDRLEREGPLPPREAARLILALARGLAHAHANGVLHRDLKPANVLLPDDGGEPKLADFGLAALAYELSQSRLTKTGALMGTPGYWSPEQAAGDPRGVGPRTDVYGLGALLFAALTGRPPFEGDSLFDVVVATQRRRPASPGADRALDALVLRCLAKRPEDRPASVEAVAHELAEWLAGRAPRASRLVPALCAIGALGAVALVIAAASLGGGEATTSAPDRHAPDRPATPEPAATELPRPPEPAPPELTTGDLDELHAMLESVDRVGVARLTDRERDELRRTLQRLDARWSWSSPGEGSLWDGPTARSQALERLILIHALLRRLDPTHRLSDQHDDVLRPVSLPGVGVGVARVGPRALGELVALRPDDPDVYLLYADAIRDPFAEDSHQVDLDVLRRGMRLAGGLGHELVWGRLLRTLASHLRARAARSPQALAELRALAAEVKTAGWADDAVAHTLGRLHDALLPDGADPAFVRACRDEALEVARSAVEVAPDEPEPHGRLALALLAHGTDGPTWDEAQVEADRFLALARRHDGAVFDEALTVRVVGSLCHVLEGRGQDRAAAQRCADALAVAPEATLLAVATRHALLLCRVGAPSEVAVALTELDRRVTQYARRLGRPTVARDELLDLGSHARRLAEDLRAGRVTPTHVAAALQAHPALTWLGERARPAGR